MSGLRNEESSPGLSVSAVHPVVHPRESTVWVGRAVTAARKASGSRGLACPPGPERMSAFIQTGRFGSASSSSSRATDGDTTSWLQREYDTGVTSYMHHSFIMHNIIILCYFHNNILTTSVCPCYYRLWHHGSYCKLLQRVKKGDTILLKRPQRSWNLESKNITPRVISESKLSLTS